MVHEFVPFNNSFLPFCDSNITDSSLTIQFLPKMTKKLVRNYKKNTEKERSQKSKQLDIKYFLTIDFMTKTTKKCENFVGSLVSLHFLLFFPHLSEIYIPMTKLYKSER